MLEAMNFPQPIDHFGYPEPLKIFNKFKETVDDEMPDLCVNLESLGQITDLQLDFWECHLTDAGVNKLSNCLTNLPSLTRVALTFSGCQSITDQGVTDLAFGLRELPFLTELQLDFEMCKLLTDGSLQILSAILDSATNITFLRLNFGGCEKLSNNGISELGLALRSLTSLKILQLSFQDCFLIDDIGLIELSHALNSIWSLTGLQLSFMCCPIGDEGVQELKLALKNSINQCEGELDLRGCSLITSNMKDELADTVKYSAVKLRLK